MPSNQSSRIQAKLTLARAKLLGEVEGLDESTWNWRPGDGRWSARLTLAHVAAARWSHLEVAQRLAAGESVDIPGFDLDTWNAAHVDQRKEWTVDQILEDLGSAQSETLSYLGGLESLAITGSHPALGQVTVGQVLRIIALHDEMHRRDIAKLKAEIGGG